MGSTTFTAVGDRDLQVTRTFDVPRRLVFDVWTGCEHLPAWSGPAGWELAACEVDLRSGGSFQYVWRSPDGVEAPTGGTYDEVVPPERVVSRHGYDGVNETIHVLDLAEVEGRTTMRYTVTYPSTEIRDAALAPVMQDGMVAGYDRLDEVLRSLE